MAITIYGTPQKNVTVVGGSTTLSLNLPNGGSSVSADTIYVVFVAQRAGTTSASITGYTSIVTSQIDGSDQQQAFYQVYSSGSTPPASITINFNAGGVSYAGAGVIAYQGMSSASPIDASGENHNTTSGASIVAPSVTTTVNGDQIINSYFMGDPGAGPTFSMSPTGPALQFDNNRNNNGGRFDQQAWDWNQASSGATGTQTLSWTGGTNSALNSGITVAIKAGGATLVYAEEAYTEDMPVLDEPEMPEDASLGYNVPPLIGTHLVFNDYAETDPEDEREPAEDASLGYKVPVLVNSALVGLDDYAERDAEEEPEPENWEEDPSILAPVNQAFTVLDDYSESEVPEEPEPQNWEDPGLLAPARPFLVFDDSFDLAPDDDSDLYMVIEDATIFIATTPGSGNDAIVVWRERSWH